MPTKSNGKSSSHHSQKSASRSGRSGQSQHGRGSQAQSKSHGSSGGSSKGSRSSSSRASGKSSGGSSQSSTQGVGAKLGKSIKDHPIVTAAIGAGAGLLLIEGVRRAVRGTSSASGGPEKSQRDRQRESEADQGESEAQGSSQERADDDDSSEEFSEDDDEEDAGPQSQRSESEGQGESGGWGGYPLLICAGALGLGAAAGLLLPSSALENKVLGKASDKFAGQLKSAGESFTDLIGDAYDKAATAAREEAERMGIMPGRLGQKVKRLAGKVRDAVSDVVQK